MTTTEQFEQLMQGLKLIAIELRETKTLVLDVVADIADLQARMEAVNARFDE